MFKLIDTMIKPILCYAAEMSGFEIAGNIENVHDQFCKGFLKLPQCTFNAFARGKYGRYPLHVYIEYFCRCIKYWVKLTRMNPNRLPHKCYKMLRNLDETGRVTWATKVRALLFQYGFGYVWLSEDVGDLNIFMKAFKQRLVDCSMQDWSAMISDSGKARHSRFIMPSLQTANYIFYNKRIKHSFPCINVCQARV